MEKKLQFNFKKTDIAFPVISAAAFMKINHCFLHLWISFNGGEKHL